MLGIDQMTFDKSEYMRTYMARRRAGKPASRLASRTAALEEIRAILSGNTKPLALKILGVIEGALTERKEP